MGFTNEGNLEENEPMEEMERVEEEAIEEEKIEELTHPELVSFSDGGFIAAIPFIAAALGVSVALIKHHLKNVKSPKEAMDKINAIKNSGEASINENDDTFNANSFNKNGVGVTPQPTGTSTAAKRAYIEKMKNSGGESVFEEDESGEEVNSTQISIADIRKKMKKLLYTLNNADFKAKERMVVGKLLDMIIQLGGEEDSFSPRLITKLDSKDATPDLAQDTMSGNQNEEKDRFHEIFEDMYKEELTDKQSEVMDTDGDGDIDAKDLANLRNKK